MADEPDDVTLRLLRRLDEKLDRVLAELTDIKPRLTSVERQTGELRVDIAGQAGRLDRIETRPDWMNRRLDLVDAG